MKKDNLRKSFQIENKTVEISLNLRLLYCDCVFLFFSVQSWSVRGANTTEVRPTAIRSLLENEVLLAGDLPNRKVLLCVFILGVQQPLKLRTLVVAWRGTVLGLYVLVCLSSIQEERVSSGVAFCEYTDLGYEGPLITTQPSTSLLSSIHQGPVIKTAALTKGLKEFSHFRMIPTGCLCLMAAEETKWLSRSMLQNTI